MADQPVVRVCDLLNPAGQATRLLTDAEIRACCETCDAVIPLSHCTVAGGLETVYRCPRCTGVLVVVAAPEPDGLPWPGRGYRLGDHVLRNAVDLVLRDRLLPKSPAALATVR